MKNITRDVRIALDIETDNSLRNSLNELVFIVLDEYTYMCTGQELLDKISNQLYSQIHLPMIAQLHNLREL